MTTTGLTKRILFVGSFPRDSCHVRGGQMFASWSLVNELKGNFEWILIDSTARVRGPRPLLERTARAAQRLLAFVWHCLTKRPDVVLLFVASGGSVVEKACMAAAGRALGARVVVAPRSGRILDDLERNSVVSRALDVMLRASDHVVTQSAWWEDFYRARLEEIGSETKIVTIQNWLDVAAYGQRPSRFEHDDRQFTVLFLGWIDTNKGVFDLLRVARTMTDERVQFLLAGDGPSFRNVQETIREWGLDANVRLLGWADDARKHELLGMADALVLPSYREGSPNAVLEAMASGLPVVASAVGAVPELVTDGVTGRTIRPGDTDALVSALRELSNDRELAAGWGRAGRQRAEERHSIERATAGFVRLFTSS